MKKQVTGSLTAILVLTLIFSSIQNTEAISYYGHDGSVSEYLEKTLVKPHATKKDTWSYTVKACATSHNLAIAGIILKSDIDRKELGVNKVIKKGDCSTFGAVMKAKDGKTLGAELIQKHEAVDKMIQILKDGPNMPDKQRKTLMKEFIKLYHMTGFLLRL